MVTVALDRVSLGALRLFSANYYSINIRYKFCIHGSKGPSLKSIPNIKKMGTVGPYSLPKATGSKYNHLLTITAAVGTAWDQTFSSV